MSQAIATRGIPVSAFYAETSTVDTTAPIWDSTTGITKLTTRLDGGLTAGWGSATDDQGGTVLYSVYVQAATATGLFASANLLAHFPNLTVALDRLPSSTNKLAPNTLYYVGVRAVDDVGNEETNTTSLSATTTGSSTDATIRKRIKETLMNSVLISVNSSIQSLENRFMYGNLAGMNRTIKFPCATYTFQLLNKDLSYVSGNLQLMVWAVNPEACDDLYSAFEAIWDNQLVSFSNTRIVLVSQGNSIDIYDPQSRMYRLVGNFQFKVLDDNA